MEPGQVFAERFQLIRKLGEGGMGQVWLAEQTSPVRRQVALKLIKAGMYDEAVVQRFQAERQSLAIMDHPAIAKVFDAGTTPQGQPYFVMEYVPGLPITEYCDREEAQDSGTAGAVHPGLRRGAARAPESHHPSRSETGQHSGGGSGRQTDGRASSTSGWPRRPRRSSTGESCSRSSGHFVGTPGYMSPEQADPSVQDIDTRTDVYSLGVVLYVLLAGTAAVRTKQWQKQPLDELLRKLREEEPPTPEHEGRARIGIRRAASAEARGTEPRQLVSLLRGDLDWITMKALEKDRARRYGAPSELAADIRRYLNHEPVVARPASAGYRLRKYARRHRVAVGVAAGLVLLLAAFSVLQAVQLRRITRERDRANRRTRSRHPHHRFHDWHVQGVRSERSARQQRHGPRDSRQGFEGHGDRSGEGS